MDSPLPLVGFGILAVGTLIALASACEADTHDPDPAPRPAPERRIEAPRQEYESLCEGTDYLYYDDCKQY